MRQFSARFGRKCLLAAGALLPLVLPGVVLAQAGSSGDREIGNIFPTAPRELRQNLTRAEAALNEQRFSDAVAELGQILNSPTSDDYFLGTPGQTDAQVSLKTQALEMLGSMPAKGRQMYELQFGAEAKAQLETALADGDLQKLTDVSRRYFHTKAGYEAALLLGRYQLDQGRPLAAAVTLKRIADTPSAASQYDPELSVLLATCWVHARMPERATETLLALKKRMPQAKVNLLDGPQPIFEREDEALAWLEKIVGASRTPLLAAATQWTIFRGNEMRNAKAVGGVPLLNYRWSLPTVNDPQDEQKVKSIARSTRDRGDANIVALQPLVVQDMVIARAPESNKLLGIDLKSGKRIWVFPPFDETPATQATRATIPTSARNPIPNLREQELKQRVWEDNTFGQVSSDGRQVYVIDDLGYAPTAGVGIRQIQIGPRGQPMPNSAWSKPHNLLVALDLRKQGYQVWAVGGTTGDNPNLAGAFFLGPPLPIGDLLYVLAELNGEIRLVALHAATGALDWKQQLAVVEDAQQQITLDRMRRLGGASPSYADGVLICPTSAGAVVALDLATRSLRWGYQYPRWDIVYRSNNGFNRGSSSSAMNSGQGHWIDATATIADGSVILTPIESQELHCLDLLTGKARWPAQPRDDMLFVACVHQGQIVLVGKNKLKAINLADGKAAWSEPIDLAGDAPTGRGYYSEKFYYLPVAGQQLLKIDLETGKIVSRARTEIDLGNVICYKDQLISLGSQHLASFYLSEQLVARVDETLKNNPNDPEALTLKGQVLLQEGKASESLELLRRAVAANPQSPSARTLLVKVMLSLLRDDFEANFKLADELDQLVTDPGQKRDVLRFRAQGLAQAGRLQEAFDSLVALSDQLAPIASSSTGSGADNLESTERELSVRPDRWLQGQLAGLWRRADDQVRARMAEQVQKRLEKVLADGDAPALREFLNVYGFHPLADRARLALVDKLIAIDQLLEAELLAGDVYQSPEIANAAGGHAALAVIYEKAKRYDLAARTYDELRGRYGDVVCRDGRTGAQLADRAAKDANLQPIIASMTWPTGRTEVNSADIGEGNSRIIQSQRQHYGIQLTQSSGAAMLGLRAAYDPTQYQVVIKDDMGRPLASGMLRNADGTFRRVFTIPSNLLVGKTNGHLVVVSLGNEVVAMDALRADRGSADALLWRLDAIELDTTSQRSLYAQERQSPNPLVGPKMITYDPSGRLNFYTGPVQSIGVCFQKGRQLICADPISGQVIWERAQIPASAEIFGDRELLFVADPTQEEAMVLSAVDGSLLGRRKLEKADRRWATHGRRVLAWDQVGSSVKLRLYDGWAGGDDLFARQFPTGSRGCLIDGDEVAVLEPSGQFTVVSLADGQVRFTAQLQAEKSLAWIGVQRSREQYILIASQDTPDSLPNTTVLPITHNRSQNRVHGRVYAFDRAGKPQWQVPAFVALHCLPPDQPAEMPLLVFVRNLSRNSGGSAARSSCSVLCIDKRDGRIVWETDTAAGQSNHVDIVADPVKKNVQMTLWSPPTSKQITFQLTDKPAPPQPPAQTGDLASNSVSQPAGQVDRSIDAAFELLNRGLDPAKLLPGAPRPLAVPADAPRPPR